MRKDKGQKQSLFPKRAAYPGAAGIVIASGHSQPGYHITSFPKSKGNFSLNTNFLCKKVILKAHKSLRHLFESVLSADPNWQTFAPDGGIYGNAG